MRSSQKVLFGLLIIASALGFYDGTDVIELTPSNFAEQVFGSEHVWLVEFYAPWCGHCKNLKPTWERIAKTMKGVVKVAAVNCDEHREIAAQFGVQGFPTIKLFPSEMKKQGNGWKKDPIDYNGARSARAISEFALNHLPNFVTAVTSEKEEQFLSTEKDLTHVLLFSEKAKTTDLYKALSTDFHHRLVLGQVHAPKQPSLVEKYDVSDLPALLVLAEDGVKRYDGQLKHAALYKFLEPFAGPPVFKGASPPPPPPAPVFTELQHITSQADLEELCGKIRGSCAIAVLDKENSGADMEAHVAMLRELNDKHQSTYRFGWVDKADAGKYISEFQLYAGFPSLTVVNFPKKRGVVYAGAFESEKISSWLDQFLRKPARSFPVDTSALI